MIAAKSSRKPLARRLLPAIAALAIGFAALPPTTLHSQPAASPATVASTAPDADFQSAKDPSGGGLIWRTTAPADSAQALAADAVRQLSTFVDAPLVFRRGYASDDGKLFQGVFSTVLKGAPISCMMTATISPDGKFGWIGMIYDRPENLQASAAGLLTQLAQHYPGAAAATESEKAADAAMSNAADIILNDGSRVRLPRGWQIVRQSEGAFEADAEDGACIIIGQDLYIASPEAAAAYERTLHAPWDPRNPVGRITDGPSAVRTIINTLGKLAAASGKVIKLIDIPESVVLEQSQYAFHSRVRSIIDMGDPSHIQRIQSIADIRVIQTDKDHWLYFCNAFNAPEASLARDMPIIQRITLSYQLNPQVLANAQDRLARVRCEAAKGLEASAIRMMQSSDKNFQQMDEIINNSVRVTDGNGRSYVLPKTNEKEYIEALNKKFGGHFHSVSELPNAR